MKQLELSTKIQTGLELKIEAMRKEIRKKERRFSLVSQRVFLLFERKFDRQITNDAKNAANDERTAERDEETAERHAKRFERVRRQIQTLFGHVVPFTQRIAFDFRSLDARFGHSGKTIVTNAQSRTRTRCEDGRSTGSTAASDERRNAD